MGEPTDASFSGYPNVFVITVREREMIKMLIFNVTLVLLLACSPMSRAAIKTRLKRDLYAPSGSLIWPTESADSPIKRYILPHSLSPSSSSSDILHALGTTTLHTLPSADSTSGLRHPAKTTQSNWPSNFSPQRSQPTYSPQANGQYRNKLASLPSGSDKSQYFANPSSYKILPEARPSQFPVSTNVGSFSSAFPKFSKYRFASGDSRPTGYKTTPHSLASNNNNNNNNDNIKIPSPSQQSAKNEPVFQSTGSDYQPRPSPTSGPVSTYPNIGKTRNYRTRILPIKSTGSTPEIPIYQAASVDETALNRYEKPFEGYQQLANQPQFHFTRGTTAATPNSQSNSEEQRQPIVYHEAPFQRIRTDVELINKKRTTTPDPFGSEENDFGQVFSTASHNFGQSSARDENFQLPSSNLFDSYDQTFGKYSKLASLEEKNNKAKRPSSTKHDETTKPVHQSIEEEEEEDDEDDEDAPAAGKDDEDKSSSGEYRASYTDGKDSSGSYEEDEEEGEGEEESQRNEQQGSYEGKDERNDDDDDDDDDNDDRKKASFRSYADDFEHEFEESYRKDLPKSDYVHVKEVPEIEEPRRSETRKHSDKRPRTKTARAQQTSNRHAFAASQEAAPRKHEETRGYFADPTDNYRDSEGHGTGSFYGNAKSIDSSSHRIDDSYGHKIPDDRRLAKLTVNKKQEDEKRRKKTVNLTENRAEKSTNFYYPSTPVPATTTTIPSVEQLQSYTFGPFANNDWKPSEKTADRDIYGETRQEIRAIFSPKKSANLLPSAEGHNLRNRQPDGPTRSTNGHNFRDLRGI